MPMLALLIFLGSGALALFGVIQLAPATLGVGLIALACYAAIVARLAQASGHLDALVDALGKTRKAITPTIVKTPPPPVDVQSHEIQCSKCGAVNQRGPAICHACGAKLR